MRRHLRRLFWMGVLLVVAGLVFYIAAQWTVKNPLSFRAVELVRGWEGESVVFRRLPEPYTLIYEVKNESPFPVTVYRLASADIHADGSTPDLDRAFIDPRLRHDEFILKPGEAYRGKLQGPNLGGKEVWLEYIWEPEIRRKMSGFLEWVHSHSMDLPEICREWGSLEGLVKRRNDVAGPALVPEPTQTKGE